MAFSWRLSPPGAFVAPDTAASFTSQSDAESWLGEHWREMAAAGVKDVTLSDGATAVYDMTLQP